MLNVRKPIQNKPPRVVIYGTEGVGKTNFGINATHPVVVASLEDRVDHLKRVDGKDFDIADLKSWDDVRKFVRSLINENHNFKSLVIDSADWLEKLCHARIIGDSDKDIIRVNGGYSAGLREAEKLHRELLADLSDLRDKKGMAIIVTAHYHVREEKNPEAIKDYDTFQIKLDERVSSLWREWADAIFFAKFNTYVKGKDNEKAKAFTDHGRSVFASRQAFCQAKNVYGMPKDAMEFKEDFWNVFESYFSKGMVEEKPEEVMTEIAELTSKIDSDETKVKILKTAEAAGNNVNELKAIRQRVREITA